MAIDFDALARQLLRDTDLIPIDASTAAPTALVQTLLRAAAEDPSVVQFAAQELRASHERMIKALLSSDRFTAFTAR